MKALEKAPSQRYQSAREFAAVWKLWRRVREGPDLHSNKVGRDCCAGERRRPRCARASRLPRLTVLGITVLVAILTAGLLIGLNVKNLRERIFHRGTREITAATVPGAIKVRPSVAVLGFKNVSGRPEEAWLSTALSEMLTTELAAGEQLRTVPGENVARMKVDLSLPDADTYGKETLGVNMKELGNGRSGAGRVRAAGERADTAGSAFAEYGRGRNSGGRFGKGN